MLLGELTQSVRNLPGVGNARASALAKLGISALGDLLRHLPRSYEDRKRIAALSAVGGEGTVNTEIKVIEHGSFYARGRKTLKVIVTDDTDAASLLCFGRDFLAKVLVPGRSYRLYGQFYRRQGELQSASFVVEPVGQKTEDFGKLLPIYPLTAGINQAFLRKAVRAALGLHGDSIEEELPERIRLKRGIASLPSSLSRIHFPDEIDDVETSRKSLAFGELFYLNLTMQRRALRLKSNRRRRRTLDRNVTDRFTKRLDFDLTEDQLHSFSEIKRDLESPTTMMRLLQGDVGCGKTLVALLAASVVAAVGEQAAFMAPTELLARQQAETAAAWLEPLGYRIGFLSGSIAEAPRRRLLSAIRGGEIDIVVGTHALFSADVEIPRLGLVVIDEQHRFGVLQRLAIVEKGDAPDLLLMTATPIPRSLALTVFGDLDVSTIRTMPAGRLPIRTHLARTGNENKVYDRVRRELEAGRQAYFVYPLIGESDKLDLKHAEGMYESLSADRFKDYSLALIHSRVSEDEKRERMAAFVAGDIDVLVATSVVEVGVDVANATCMVIEHAERFGLAALHQLRGRVGRSDLQSYAFLVYDSEITEEAKQRLRIMLETTDGFRIAEEDLKMRGPGELTGTHQTGELELAFADIIADFELLKASRSDVSEILSSDPGLQEPENAVIREVVQRCPPFSERTTVAG